MLLQATFEDLLVRHAGSASTTVMWQELESAYTHPKRHYHTLAHLQHMLLQLVQVKEQVTDWDTVLFALYYHDAVYNVLKQDNEEKSAALAARRMTELGIPAAQISQCCEWILLTKSHAPASVPDADMLTDADLCILGASPLQYQAYAAAIRKEYAVYPDLLYRPGRKKVLQHFLAMPCIFKTSGFRTLFEKQARENLAAELAGL